MPLGYKRVRDLTPQDIQELLGTQEDIELDFKREPYANAYDLCIDVASMANAEGGYIVVGMNLNPARKRSASEPVDAIERVLDEFLL